MCFRALIGGALLNALIVWVPAFAQAAVPRYKLKVGQEIQYHVETQYHRISDPNDAPDVAHTETTRTLWIVARNGDGSWRVVQRDQDEFHETPKGQPATTSVSESVSTFDVFSDGKLAVIDPMSEGNPADAFPPLPKDAADKTWTWPT